MSRNVKVSALMVLAALMAVMALANLGGNDDAAGDVTSRSAEAMLVPPDSQRLSEAESGEVTFVEFLDFECEACRAAHPAIEQLRDEYGDRVTFVVRHFPLHRNSESAARAAEAAASQGKFEEMYDLLFQTQGEWGEQDSSQEDVFFRFAEQLGLDMDQFRAVYDDPATLAKIRRDRADGEELGVQGTPTFFLEGQKLDVRSFADLVEELDRAVSS